MADQDVKIIHEGPAHLNPKQLMNPDSGHRDAETQKINQQLQRVLRGKDPGQRREDFVNSLYDNFRNTIDRDTVLTVSEFLRYEELFSHKIREQYLSGDLDEETLQRLENLSQEFYDRVNTQRPIHIVSDTDRKQEVCDPIPPIFMPLQTLHGKGGEAVDILHNAFIRDDQVKGGMGEVQRAKATANLSQLFVMSQNQEAILERMAQFDEIAQNFHTHVLGKPVFQESGENPNTSNEQGTTPQNPVDDLFDFAPVDD